MGAITFSWGSSGDIPVIGKHTLSVTEDSFAFESDFEATRGGDITTDAAFKTLLDTAHGYIGKNKAFTLKVGASTVLSFDPSANTGFLTHAHVSNLGDRRNTSRSAIRRFSVVGQKPASQDSRVGRREASLLISRKRDGLRSVRVAGVWTALATPLTALASYDASIATWVATWLGASNPLAPVTGGYWVLTSETPLALDEQNKLLTFERTYDERKYVSDPADAGGDSSITGTPNGTIMSAVFTELPTLMQGQTPNLQFELGRASLGPRYVPAGVTGGSQQTKSTAVPTSNFLPASPSRYSFAVDVEVLQSYGTPLAWFEATGLAWVRATLRTLWPESAGEVFDGLSVSIHDGNQRRATVSGTVLAAPSSGILSYHDVVEVASPQTDTYRKIFNGKAYSYDKSGGPPEAFAVQTITIIKLDSTPSTPSYLGSPWANLDYVEAHSSKRIGWSRVAGDPKKNVYEHTFVRHYQRVDDLGAAVDFPQFNSFGPVITK